MDQIFGKIWKPYFGGDFGFLPNENFSEKFGFLSF